MLLSLAGFREPVSGGVVLADSTTQRLIRGGRAAGFNPAILVRRTDALGSELPPDPVGFLDQADARPQFGNPNRGGYAAEAPANHQNIRRNMIHAGNSIQCAAPTDSKRNRA